MEQPSNDNSLKNNLIWQRHNNKKLPQQKCISYETRELVEIPYVQNNKVSNSKFVKDLSQINFDKTIIIFNFKPESRMPLPF